MAGPRRALIALAVAASLLTLLLALALDSPLAAVPSYLAVALAFLLILIAPGALLARAALGGNTDWLVLAVVALALGLGVLAVPGAVALELHLSLREFAIMHAVVAALAAGLAVFWTTRPSGDRPAAAIEEQGGGLVAEQWLLGALLVMALGGVMTTPFWAADRISGDFDDWTYMAYVQEFLDTDSLNAEEPFLGSGEAVNPRMRTNVWVLFQAQLARSADVPPQDVVLEYLPPMLTVFAVLATYALSLAIFRNRSVALLGALFFTGYALIDLGAHEGLGRNVLIRISEDKMVAGFLLMPIALCCVARFVERSSFGVFGAFAGVCLALAFVHPVPLAFVAVAIVCLAALRAFMGGGPAELRRIGLLLLPVALFAIWPFAQRQLLAGSTPEVFDSATRFREEFHFVRLRAHLLIGNYHLILHPLMIAAIVAAPLVWLASRREVGNQLILAMTAGALLLFFFPPFATPLSEVLAPQTLSRVPWMIPVAPVLAFAVYAGSRQLAKSLFGSSGSTVARWLPALLPAGLLVLVLALALVIQEQYARADDSAFYTATSGEALLPANERSIFRGGLDFAFSGTWRMRSYEEAVFERLGEIAPRGSVVLIEPAQLGYRIPGLLTDIYPVDGGGLGERDQRQLDADAFERAELSVSELEAVIDRYGVSFIIVREVEPEHETVQRLPDATLVEEVTPYFIYRVERSAAEGP